MYSLSEWLCLTDQQVAQAVASRISTAVVYLNGTRRWFLSQHKDWADYTRVVTGAHRALSQLFYDHGIQTLIQPFWGYDLLTRGPDYLKLAIEQGLLELSKPDYQSWFQQMAIRVTLYGNWESALSDRGFSSVVEALHRAVKETAHYTGHKLLLGLFADEGLENIAALAKEVRTGEALLNRYYGQPAGPVDLIVGSGQPAIWDLPLLDVNKASLYFVQAPTFCLTQRDLRQILYDHLYQRVNDDGLYDHLSPQAWQNHKILGLGQQTGQGWVAL